MKQFFVILAVALCIGALPQSPSTSTPQVSTKQAVKVTRPEVKEKTSRSIRLNPRQRVAFELKRYEKSQTQINCALHIAYQESRYNQTSVNKTSGAHGVFQLLHSKRYLKLKKHVFKATEYMEHRYGTWCKADAFHTRNGWW